MPKSVHAWQGLLTATDPDREYVVKLEGGRTYVIEMSGASIFLRLHDDKGTYLAADRSTDFPQKSASLMFTPKQTGNWTIVAARISDVGNVRVNYWLSVSEIESDAQRKNS